MRVRTGRFLRMGKGHHIALLNELWNPRVEPPRRYAPLLLVQGGKFLQIAWERYMMTTANAGAPPLTGTASHTVRHPYPHPANQLRKS